MYSKYSSEGNRHDVIQLDNLHPVIASLRLVSRLSSVTTLFVMADAVHGVPHACKSGSYYTKILANYLGCWN